MLVLLVLFSATAIYWKVKCKTSYCNTAESSASLVHVVDLRKASSKGNLVQINMRIHLCVCQLWCFKPDLLKRQQNAFTKGSVRKQHTYWWAIKTWVWVASSPKQENEEYIHLACSAIYQSIGAGWSEQGLRIILSDQVMLSGKRLCQKTIFFGTLNITK